MVASSCNTAATARSSNLPPKQQRGAFVLLEGVDRCGKTTQCKLLLQRLVKAGVAATAMRFPNRSTATGQLIDNYLTSSNNLNDRAIHLLFSANRWEAVDELERELAQGTTVVCDRYAYSGVAFSAAKVDDHGRPVLPLDWCQSPDKGLPAPDCVIFLDLSQDEAEKRGGFGEERYEKRDLQLRVRQRFDDLHKIDAAQSGGVPWKFIEAAQSIEQVEADIWNVVQETLQNVANEPELRTMWSDKDIVDKAEDDESVDDEAAEETITDKAKSKMDMPKLTLDNKENVEGSNNN